uniref:Uncharacterized protein n=1 Tax=Meloidogyne incognita TaxID=6306 RepID=A0A914MG41_MELIC
MCQLGVNVQAQGRQLIGVNVQVQSLPLLGVNAHMPTAARSQRSGAKSAAARSQRSCASSCYESTRMCQQLLGDNVQAQGRPLLGILKIIQQNSK